MRHGWCGRPRVYRYRMLPQKGNSQQHIDEIEEQAKSVATCAYEASNTQWGREMGVKYGCPVEDVGLLQPAEEGVPGPRSDDACSDAAAAQEVRRGQLLHSALAVLLGVVWAWKDRAAAAAGLLHLRSMGSKLVAYAVLRYRPLAWPPQGHPFVPGGGDSDALLFCLPHRS